MTTKDQLRRAVEALPEDTSFSEALDRLYVLYKVERGAAELDAGKGVPTDEARRRILSKWDK